MGERPTDPELLEYLAKWFVDNGMSVKKLHREILLSAVYQLSDEGVKENLDKDPRTGFIGAPIAIAWTRSRFAIPFWLPQEIWI